MIGIGKIAKPGRMVILAGLLVIAAIAVSLYLLNMNSITGGSIIQEAAPGISDGVMVNGEPISFQEIDDTYNSLPEEARQQTTREEVAGRMVNWELLTQESRRKGIVATEADVDLYLEQANGLGFDTSGLEAQLASQGLSMEEYREELGQMIAVTRLLTEEIGLQGIQATDGEVEQFIEDNRQELQFIFDENDPGAVELLKGRIKLQLSEEKQAEAIGKYVESLKQNAVIEY